jgi:hypothetical protein
MKKFLLGVVVGITLMCGWGIVTATLARQARHNAINERNRAVKAEQAARAAAENAAPIQ